jgi:HEAT repeat protein
MLLCAAWLCSLAAAGPLDGLAAVRSVLQRTEGDSSCRDEVLVRRLTALGNDAAPALFTLVSGEALDEFLGETGPEAWLCPLDRVSPLALEALGNLPAVPVRQCLRAQATKRPERDVRVAAMNVLGRQGSADGLPLFFQLLAESGEELELRSVRTQAQEALLAILRADGTSTRALEAPLLAAPLAQQRLVCEALARATRADAVGLLMKVVGRDAELDLVCIEALTELVARQPWRMPQKTTGHLRACLEHPDARLRASAARALGRLRDMPAVPGLIAHLGDADPATARAALWALRECTGQARLTTADEWQSWHAAEREWWKQEGRARVEALASGESGALSSVLRDVLAHPLGRSQVAEALLGLLPGLEPGAKALACAALARLRARAAVPALVELLFETDPAVREAAWAALRALTGENLPAEPRLWEEYAFG